MADEQQINKLHQSVQGGLEASEAAISEIEVKLGKHDEASGLSEKASSYMKNVIEAAKHSLNDLRCAAVELKEHDAAKGPINVVQNALIKVQGAMDEVKSKAAAYDESYHVSGTLSTAKSELVLRNKNIQSSIEEMVTSAKDRTVAVLNAAVEQAQKIHESMYATTENVGKSALTTAGGIINKIEKYDQYYQVSAKVSVVASAATEKAKELDDYYGVSKKAMNLDQRAGGYGTAAVVKGSELLNSGTDYVAETLHTVKEAAAGEDSSVKNQQ